MHHDTYAMEAMLAYRFRVYPNAKNRREIDGRLVLAKDFYNFLLENAIKAYKENWSRVTMAPLNSAVQLLTYRAESAGMKVTKVNVRNTSKTCNTCGNVQDIPLSERRYNCQRCGMSKDKDINASINILHRATTLWTGGKSRSGRECKTP